MTALFLHLRVVAVCNANNRRGSPLSITICLRSAAEASTPHQQFGNTVTVSLNPAEAAAVAFPREVMRARVPPGGYVVHVSVCYPSMVCTARSVVLQAERETRLSVQLHQSPEGRSELTTTELT